MPLAISSLLRRSSLQQLALPLSSLLADLSPSKHLFIQAQTPASPLQAFTNLRTFTFSSLLNHQEHYQNPGESTVNQKEAKKFAKLAGEWWDPTGPFRPLHQLNPTRCKFIRTSLCDHFNLDPLSTAPLAGLRLLDVGCGGGILSEALARMGASVHGIDVNKEGIDAAASHAALDPVVAERVEYSTITVEEVAASGMQYDAVIASEVIEHVASVPAFCNSLVSATAPQGAVVVSTLNRTVRAYALAIVAAENILRWAAPGTHEWSKFLTPDELCLAMEEAGHVNYAKVDLDQISGMIFDPVKRQWGLGRDLGINYIAYFRKEESVNNNNSNTE